MKKTYNAPYITVTEVETVMMTGSVGLDETEAGNFNSARSRRHNIEWIEDDDDDM